MTLPQEAMRLAELLEKFKGSPDEVFHKRDLWRLQREWRRAFAPVEQSWSGDLGKLDWHIFSYGYAPSVVEGHAAIEAYESLPGDEMFVAASLDRGPAFRCRFVENPRYGILRSRWPGDLYLASSSMKWTFVITHEEFCGPYYSERASHGETDAVD